MPPQFRKTRIAPTPSGFLHIGNAYSFLITEQIARKTGAKILLRIDDLDTDRTRAQYVQDIFDTLSLLEIKYDEGPQDFGEYRKTYSQLHRGALYEAALQQLADQKLIFACACSRSVLEDQSCACRAKNISLNTPDTAWRLCTDESDEISMQSLEKGVLKNNLPAAMKDFIVRKKDGRPSYQLASLTDDVHFGVDLVVRGQDLLDSTLAQLYLADKLGLHGFAGTVFLHHPLMKNESGVKWSKSAGAEAVKELSTGDIDFLKNDVDRFISSLF